jgi:hypothetical protein
MPKAVAAGLGSHRTLAIRSGSHCHSFGLHFSFGASFDVKGAGAPTISAASRLPDRTGLGQRQGSGIGCAPPAC